MGTEYPECDSDNPSDSKHSKEYVTLLSSSERVFSNHTMTLETSRDELTAGKTFARRYQIFEERGKSGKD